jgi:hypothetical protein
MGGYRYNAARGIHQLRPSMPVKPVTLSFCKVAGITDHWLWKILNILTEGALVRCIMACSQYY